MSVSRKDWSALSSLALQRSLEDEEEQERERRRRHRNLSSTTDSEAPRLSQNGTQRAAERLPSVEEAEVPKSPAPASRDADEDFQAILRTRKERRQRRQLVETAQAPVQESLEVEEGKDSSGPEQTMQQPPVPKKEPELLPRRRLSQKQRGPWAQMEEAGAEKKDLPEEEAVAPQKTSVSERSPVPQKSAMPTKRLSSEKARVSEKGPASEKTSLTEQSCGSEELAPARTSVSERSPIPEKTPVTLKTAASEKRSPEKKLALEKASVLDKMQERRLVSDRASIFEKPLGSETKLAPKKAATSEEPQAPGGSQATTGEPRGRAAPGKSTPSSAEQGVPDPPTMASRLPPITLQVKIPRKDEEPDTSSPTLLTYSSSLKRSSPRTISFRMSPKKDNSAATLTRSASVRLPASTVKLGEKLERYHTAVQRSESVKTPSNSRTEFFVAPAGVASRRHLFEKEMAGQSRTEPASSRKENLRLSGVVTSRLNLWISKTQESGDQTPQEVQRETAVTRRTQWGNKPTTSLDAEV